MNAKELRIGNNLDFEGAICEVKEIDSSGAKVLFKGGEETWIDLFQLGKLPLTEEILLDCGFEKDNIWEKFFSFLKDDVVLELKDGVFLNQIGRKIEHLHQLQNLYFALTNKELIFNPK